MPLQPVILPEAKPKAERKPRKTKVYKEYVPGPGPFGMVKQAAVDRIVRTEREALYWMEQ
jgi:hypothetical protein